MTNKEIRDEEVKYALARTYPNTSANYLDCFRCTFLCAERQGLANPFFCQYVK